MRDNEKIKNIKENVCLADYTTFRIGGRARYFFEVKEKKDLINILKWAKNKNIPFFVLGGGSNLLVKDEGFDGLVIKIQNSKFNIKNSKIIADAGVPLAKLVVESVNNNLRGLEWAVGIPGTLGGAIFGNTGAYGHSISENIIKVKVLNLEGKILNFKNKECFFSYRESVFKKRRDLIIMEAELKLRKDKDNLVKEQVKEILRERKNKIPNLPSAGSVFKNYVLKENDSEKDFLIKKFPELKLRIKGNKLPVSYLIEQCGLKGKIIGQAQISLKHSNFIVNLGKAKASDVLKLIEVCKKKVKEKFKIDIEEEIIYL